MPKCVMKPILTFTMPLHLSACGSNGSAQLSLHHQEDVSFLTPCEFHPSLEIADTDEIIDLVSSSAHSLLILRTSSGNILLGAGTNTLGQLGPRCALWDDVKPETRFKPLDFLRNAGVEGDWEPVKIAATWTTSFVVFQRALPPSDEMEGPSGAGGSSNTTPSGGLITRMNHVPQQIILACGSDDFGELGRGGDRSKVAITQPSDNPIPIDIGLKPGEYIGQLKAGQRHVIVLVNGPFGQRLVGWGASRKGELHPHSAMQSAKAKGKSSFPAISAATEITLSLENGITVCDVAVGASHTLLLLSDGTTMAWGSDLKGQITELNNLKNVEGVAATWGGSYVVIDGQVWSQGSNTHGQLLRGATAERTRGLVDPRGEVKRIVAGSEHLLVLINKGKQEEVWVGGWNEHGNLGQDDQKDRAELARLNLNGRVKGIWGGLAATWVWTDN